MFKCNLKTQIYLNFDSKSLIKLKMSNALKDRIFKKEDNVKI